MRTIGLIAAAVLVAGLFATPLRAEPPAGGKLVIDGQTITTQVDDPKNAPFDTLYSGWRFRSSDTRDIEADDFENPGMIAVDQARDLWNTPAGTSNKSCADCHGAVEDSMKGLRANMPKWSEEAKAPWTLEDWINWSITKHQGAEAWDWESKQMLSMTALIGLQSRGMPMHVQTDGPMADWIAKGKKLYYTRFGQLDMACANCHEDNFGKHIRADHLSQGMINGFPTYRLKWQGLGSLHRRFKGCMTQVRATPFKPGSDEFTALEAYLALRGSGLDIETPAVRN